MLEDVVPCKTMLTVNAGTVKAANTRLSQEHMESWCIHIVHIKTPLHDHYWSASALCC